MAKKVVLVGNHSCSNRGDAAIVRGLIQHLKKEHPDWEQTIISRNPSGAEIILGEVVQEDTTRLSKKNEVKTIGRLLSRGVRRFCNIDPIVLFMIMAYRYPFAYRLLPVKIKKMIDTMRAHDAVIQVGGSFFVDLYGMSQFRLLMCSLLAGKSAYLIGHSLGPFSSGRLYAPVAGWILHKMKGIVLRDEVSKNLINKRYPNIDYKLGADTAWLVNPDPCSEKEKAVAITVRELSPFDKRLGVTQEEYENWMAKICEILIHKGYEIRFYSTCTSFDGYHKDDRVVAESVRNRVKEDKRDAIYVCMDELTDVELGRSLSKCVFTIGTRLHSAIISMNFGTPAIAIAYEHKAIGMYRDMGLEQYVIDLSRYHEVDMELFLYNWLEYFASKQKFFNDCVAKQRLLAEESASL